MTVYQRLNIDDAIEEIILCMSRPNCLLAKIDIKHAFRLLPVYQADRHLLGMEWRGSIYLDNCLPFGLRSVPRLFNVMADLSWITRSRGVSFSIHYLDDYLTAGPVSANVIWTSLKPPVGRLALEKVEGPTTCLIFLIIMLDTHRMEIRLPDDKLK